MIVYTATRTVSEKQLQQSIVEINRELDSSEQELSLQVVKDNPNLLEYLCEAIVSEGDDFDTTVRWNANSFHEWHEHLPN